MPTSLPDGKAVSEHFLRVSLLDAVKFDTDYERRYRAVFRAVALALNLGMSAGVRIDPAEPAWPVVYIELPTGQVSWHMPEHPDSWDGHTTAQKHDRIRAFCQSAGERLYEFARKASAGR